VIDAMLQACECVFILRLNHFSAEDIALVPDTFYLHLEFKWTEFQKFNDLQVGTVDDISRFQKDNVLFNVDLLVLHFGRDILFLEEVCHFNVDLCGAHRYNHFDVAHVAVLAVGVQAMLLNDLINLAQVALSENAPIHPLKALYQLVYALPVGFLDGLV